MEMISGKVSVNNAFWQNMMWNVRYAEASTKKHNHSPEALIREWDVALQFGGGWHEW